MTTPVKALLERAAKEAERVGHFVPVVLPDEPEVRKYSEGQPREPAGSPEGGQFAGGGDGRLEAYETSQAAMAWSGGPGHSGISSSEIRAALAGQDLTDQTRAAGLERGERLVRAVNASPPTEYPIYRGLGMTARATFDQLIATMQPGAAVDMNLSSWTTKENIAREFASNSWGTIPSVWGPYSPYQAILTLEPGAHAYDATDDIYQGPQYAEHLTAGRFEVVSATIREAAFHGDPPMAEITVRQVATLDPDQLVGTKMEHIDGAHQFLPWLEALLDQRMVPVTTQKYSEDQPRDDHGRWVDAGGGSLTAAAPLPTVGEGTLGIFAPIGDDPLFDRYTTDGRAVHASLDDRRRLKDELSRQVGDRMAKELTPEQLRAAGIAERVTMHRALSGDEYTPQQAMASYLVGTWAQTSGDHDPLALAIQEAAAREFGVPNQTMEHYDLHPDYTRQRDEVYEGNRDVLHAYVRAVYANTQDRLRSDGISELTLHRGFYGRRTDDGPHAISLNPLSSFSTQPVIAHEFAGEPTGNGFIASAVVPADRIFSLASTGPGCLTEYEVIVLGGEGDQAYIQDAIELAGADG